MRIEVSREVLLGGLGRVGSVVERRQTLPILANILVRVSQGRIELVGTDLEIEVRTSIEAVTAGEGELTLPARKIFDICRALPEGSDIRIDVEAERAVVRSGRGRFTLGTLPARDYPVAEGRVAEQHFTVKSRALRLLLEKAAFAMAQQDVRYYLNGLLLEVKRGVLNAVATDGHRLAKASRRVDVDIEQDVQVILTRKTVLELLRQVTDKEETVQVELAGKFVRVSFDSTIINAKVIDARYPDYDRVIPRAEGRPVQIPREAFRQALTRTAILSNEKYKGVQLHLAPGVLRLKAHNPEQEEAEEELSVVYEGEPLGLAFNVSYLADVLGALSAAEVEVRILEENGSLRVIEEGDQTNTYVIMSMRL